MEVILLETVPKLGQFGDLVRVRPGHARNFLIPQGKATLATPENRQRFEERRAELERVAAEAKVAAEQRAEAVRSVGAVTVPVKAGEGGRLFGSVTNRDVAEALTHAGVAVEKREIQLDGGAFRELGEYEARIELHGEVVETIQVHVVAEQ